ncbi:hypothetical protein JKP88DRAFT_291169 [Tribonema minus]|uniref:Uncharacterized protein n=1 Tax=Tribonema minus TaxID=303371 RepID=A0A835YZD0_9STRA|nr:hypothetical protein JKP88DRAFT_291169 [Tribonema minus]
MGQQQQQEQQEQQQQQPQPEPLRRGRQPDVASSATEQLAALHSQALADAHAALVMEPPLQTEDGEYCGTGYLLQHEGLLLVLGPNETKEFLVYGLEAGAMRAAACDPQRFTIVARMLGAGAAGDEARGARGSDARRLRVELCVHAHAGAGQ